VRRKIRKGLPPHRSDGYSTTLPRLAVMAGKIGAVESLHVEGLYDKIRNRELTLALRPDPRLALSDVPPDERAALERREFSPTVLYQVEELLNYEPVRLPRWLLGGNVTCPQARGWRPYESRRHDWFILTRDDVLVPAD
jgi:hypothetical protein